MPSTTTQATDVVFVPIRTLRVTVPVMGSSASRTGETPNPLSTLTRGLTRAPCPSKCGWIYDS